MQLLADGILLLYHHPLVLSAPTVIDHVKAFSQYSQFQVFSVNTEFGIPKRLGEIEFRVIVLHYSLFPTLLYQLNENFLSYLGASASSYKIAFFQDEHRFCANRFKFLNDYGVHCVFTLLEPPYFDYVYGKNTRVQEIVSTLPGYVSEDLIEAAKRLWKPDHARTVDVGYRTRRLEYYMGRGAQEKTEIAQKFIERTARERLRLDIRVEESDRIYGQAWYKFLADCRGVLGVETGVSIFDIHDTVRRECQKLITQYPGISFEELSNKVLRHWEDNIFYRTIGPRHFEAAAFRVCQILFEGKYSGILKPLTHYIPLKKDFSNIRDVIHLLKDEAVRQELTENAYRDLIESRRCTYEWFIKDTFDPVVMKIGLQPRTDSAVTERVNKLLNQGSVARVLYGGLKKALYSWFPGRAALVSLSKPILRSCQRFVNRWV